MDSARLENGIEARERDAFAADEKRLEFEAEFTRAFLGARGERGMKARASGRAFGFVEIDGGDHAAKHLVTRTAHFGHDGADERIRPVAGGFSGGADARGRIGSNTRGAAECLRNGGAGKSEGSGEGTDGRGGGHELGAKAIGQTNTWRMMEKIETS